MYFTGQSSIRLQQGSGLGQFILHAKFLSYLQELRDYLYIKTR